MKIYWVIILTVLATVKTVGAEWNIPQGLTLVASPVSGPVSSVLQDQASRIDSMWHISKATPKWKFYSGSTQVLQSSTHPHIEALQANHGYVVQASQTLQIATNPISIPAITPATGFQLTPLVPWDSAPIPVANIANTLAASGPLHAIFTLEAGQWLAYFHNPNLATQNIRNQFNSVGTLTEVTAGRAYFVSFSPSSEMITIRNHKTEHTTLNLPQVMVGNVPGRISGIVNGEALIVPLSSSQPFTFTTWPDAVKFRTIESQVSFNSLSEFEFRMTDQTAPATHYASASANQFQSTIDPFGQTNSTITLNANISGVVFTTPIPGILTASGSSTNSGLDANDGHSDTFSTFGFAVSNYIGKLEQFPLMASHIPGFVNIPLTLKFAVPQTKFSISGSNSTFSGFVIPSFQIAP
jgi:hypothetical protein